MDEKVRLIGAIVAEEASMSELCERFGVSRKTGYKWLRRYRELGAPGLVERSHAPQVVPWAISVAQREAIVGVRQAHPRWGPKKLRAKLSERAPAQSWPAPSTIGELLKREGLVAARRRRRAMVPNPTGLSVALAANDLWCIDFKGWFRTLDGRRCDPLTVSDGFSRYLLCSRALHAPRYAECRRELERVFREYGLPRVIRSDNGAPFASLAAGGLSRLSAWWVKLGITPERIAPGKPEQNGRHERMHRTLKAETASPPAATFAQQQRRFDRFRQEFNHERPHEALAQTAPIQHYTASPRVYPAKLEDPPYGAEFEPHRVRTNGEVRWLGELVFVSEALTGELVAIRENHDGNGELFFGPVPLGVIDAVSLKLIRTSPRRRGG